MFCLAREYAVFCAFPRSTLPPKPLPYGRVCGFAQENRFRSAMFSTSLVSHMAREYNIFFTTIFLLLSQTPEHITDYSIESESGYIRRSRTDRTDYNHNLQTFTIV